VPGVLEDSLRDQLWVLDEVRRRVEHARDDDLVGREPHLLEHAPLVCVARVGGFDGKTRRPRPQKDREDVPERHVAVVWPLVVAPADVQAHPLGRQSGHCVVEGFHVHGRDLLELPEREVLELVVPSGRKIGTVELEDEAGSNDGGVLALEDVGQSAHVRLVGGVVTVQQEPGRLPGRHGRHEDVLGAGPAGGLREPPDVPLDGAEILPRDGPGARRPAEDRGATSRRELGKLLEIGPHYLVRVRPLEAGEAVFDVRRVIRPTLLAVVDDVDARRHLRPDGLVDRRARPRDERRGRRPGIVLTEERHQVVRSRQASDVRREDLHLRYLSSRRARP